MSKGEHQLRLFNDGTALAVLKERLTALSGAAALDERTDHDLHLVLEELVTNTLTHGYGSGRPGWVEVSVRCSPEGVHVRLEDAALPFDPLIGPPHPLGGDLRDRAPGGVGLALVRRLTRRGRYHREGGHNHLAFDLRTPPA